MAKVIDVSYYQRDLNYDTAVAVGVKGVIAKTAEGTSIEDTWWGHVSECETRDIPWGVYCSAKHEAVLHMMEDVRR